MYLLIILISIIRYIDIVRFRNLECNDTKLLTDNIYIPIYLNIYIIVFKFFKLVRQF